MFLISAFVGIPAQILPPSTAAFDPYALSHGFVAPFQPIPYPTRAHTGPVLAASPSIAQAPDLCTIQGKYSSSLLLNLGLLGILAFR